MTDYRRVACAALAIAAATWVALLVTAPWTAAAPGPCGGWLYAVGSLICHQRPERSFHLGRGPTARVRPVPRPLCWWRGGGDRLGDGQPSRPARLAGAFCRHRLGRHWSANGRDRNRRVTGARRSLQRLARDAGGAARGGGRARGRGADHGSPEVNCSVVPPAVVWIVSWLVPGAGHLLQGRLQKGVVFFAAVSAMFVIGLALDGRLFPFDFSEPLVGLAAVANLAAGVPYLRRLRDGRRSWRGHVGRLRVWQRLPDRRRAAEHAGRA